MLPIGDGCVSDAAASSPPQAMQADLRFDGLREGQPVRAMAARRAQYYDATIDGAATSSPYEPGIPVPAYYPLSTIVPERQTEHIGIGLAGSGFLW